MKLSNAFFAAVWTSFALAAPGCGTDGPDEIENSCIGIVRGLCAAACDCGGSDGCIVSLESETSSGYLKLGSESICVSLYKGDCDAATEDNDYSACVAELSAPQCGPTEIGDGLLVTAACNRHQDWPPVRRSVSSVERSRAEVRGAPWAIRTNPRPDRQSGRSIL